MRWIFHVVVAEQLSWGTDGRYAPSSLEAEGFVHASYKDRVEESAKLYFPAGSALVVLAIDPRKLDVPLHIADTPRGPMPHVHGSIPREAVTVIALADVASHPDVL